VTDELTLDAASFTAPERLECQTRFDNPFGDLMRCMFEAVDPRRDGPMTVRIVDRDGVQHFPDQIIQFMLWVQAKRDNPDADLTDFDDMRFAELASAHVRGLLGKDDSNTKPSSSSPAPDSADSSPG
jgi:hypothetical protein